MSLRFFLPVTMLLLYLTMTVPQPAHYYLGYEKLRGTYITVGTPPKMHRAAYAMNAPATAIAMLVLRFRGKLTGDEERLMVGVLVPILWFMVGAFLDRALRDRSRTTVLAVNLVLAVAIIGTAFLDNPRYVMVVWIAFAAWVLWERAKWRRAATTA